MPKVVDEEAVVNGAAKVADDEVVDAVPAVVAENGSAADATPVAEEAVDAAPAAEESVDAPVVTEEAEKVAEVETTNGDSTGNIL